MTLALDFTLNKGKSLSPLGFYFNEMDSCSLSFTMLIHELR